MKGAKMLKVVGILMIIFGAISLVVSLLATVISGAATGVTSSVGVSVITGEMWASIIIALIGSVIEFVAGIIGVVNCQKHEKAGVCIIWGIMTVVMSLISNIATAILYSENFKAYSLILGLVLPVLYLIGAYQNKNDSTQG